MSARHGRLVVLVEEAFSRFLSAVSAFLPSPITDVEMIRQVVRRSIGVHLLRISVPTHHIFCHTLFSDMQNDSVNSIFVVVRLQHLSTLSQELICDSGVAVSINVMDLVEARWFSGAVNTNCIFMPLSSIFRMLSHTVIILYAPDTRIIDLLYETVATLSVSDAGAARRGIFT